jgi:hypothetical protein
LLLNQAVEALDSTCNWLTPQQTWEQMLLRSLPSCAFKNEEVRLKKIWGVIKAGACLLTQDVFRILRPILNNATNTSSTLKKLGLPDEWRGINGAVNYLRLLDKHKDNKKKLAPMAKRIT